MKWRRGRDRTNSHGEIEDDKVMDKKREQYEDILSNLAIIGDPYDNMDIQTKKTHALHHFYEYIKVI